MPNKMLIDATHPEETRVVVVDGNRVDDFDFESEAKRQLAGNIYLAKVTRVEPSLQAAFVEYGGNRHGFLAFSEIHPDYYQIPVADREALLAEEAALAREQDDEDEDGDRAKRRSRSRGRSRSRSRAESSAPGDATDSREIPGMDVVDLGEEDESGDGSAAEDDRTEDPRHDDDDRHGDRNDRGTRGRDRAGDAQDDEIAEQDEIESVAEEDVAEEIAQPRRSKPRKYKIQEVVKVRQILLVQVVKEERGNKGAALTTYLSLAGRYCVLMPNTARGGGISRKITNTVDRKKLKEIASEIDVPKGAGLIVRTAGAKRTKTEIKRDYEYLQRLWEQVRELTLRSIAPAKIYEEGNLIKRSIRDLYSRDIDEVIVEGEGGYRTAKDFMKMIMPSHAKNVKNYTEPMPLFARYQVESYLSSMFNPTVQLKSGGYIVIGVTEALVAIDVNSGRATKEGSIEETALKTNLEAAEEVARQLRLRDLAGLIVIDFIDMDERKNNAAVEKRFKDKLKVDRARIQVGRISGFGLLEMSRQRLRPGMLEATTQPCPACHGTGLVRSEDSLGLTILRQVEEEGTRRRSREVLVKAPVAIVNFLMNHKREHIAGIEARYGMSVRVEADPFLISPDFAIEKFKTATRVVKEVPTAISGDASMMPEIDEDDLSAEDIEDDRDEAEDEAATDRAEAEAEGGTEAGAESGDGDGQPKKRRRRRRRRRGGQGEGRDEGSEASGQDATDESRAEDGGEADRAPQPVQDAADMTPADAAAAAQERGDAVEAPADKPRRTRSRTRRKPAASADAPESAPATADAPESAPAAAEAPESAPAAGAPDAAEAPEAAPEPALAPDAGNDAALRPTPETAPAEAPDLVEVATEDEPEPEPAMAEKDADPRPQSRAAAAGGRWDCNGRGPAPRRPRLSPCG